MRREPCWSRAVIDQIRHAGVFWGPPSVSAAGCLPASVFVCVCLPLAVRQSVGADRCISPANVVSAVSSSSSGRSLQLHIRRSVDSVCNAISSKRLRALEKRCVLHRAK